MRRPAVLTPIAVAVLLLPLAAQAQTAASNEAQPKAELDKVVVTGLRAATELAQNLKRNASANVDVITAVDVGKMPDKNLADSLQRVVGVAVRTDYDEAEKVSMRGTNPDMSLILFNGHTVSGGDWFIADQMSSSRSTSLSLMPSSVLNSATVYKSSQANIVDGGLAGTINVTTRKPLDQKKRFGGVVSAGGVYADLPGKTSPQLNASVNWKNAADNFGLIAQVFAEKRYVRPRQHLQQRLWRVRLGHHQHLDHAGHYRRHAGRLGLQGGRSERRAHAGQHRHRVRRGRARPQGRHAGPAGAAEHRA